MGPRRWTKGSRPRRQVITALVLCVASLPGLAALAPPAGASGPVVTEVAGTGTPGTGAPAAGQVAALSQFDEGWAIGDRDGRYAVSEMARCQVRGIDLAGLVSVLAGTGTCGYGGDGGPATAATLQAVTGLAYAGNGDLLLADAGNCLIRRVSKATGVISRVAGSVGLCGSTGDGGSALSAQLGVPYGLAARGADIYVSEVLGCRVRRIDAAGVIHPVAGTGTCGFSGDGGPGASARLQLPYGVAVDSTGNVVIADTGNNRVRRVAVGGTITTIAGSGGTGLAGDGGPATAALLRSPTAVATDAYGLVYLADAENCRVRRVDQIGIITTVAGSTCGSSGNRGPATSARFGQLLSVAVTPGGDVVVDDANGRVSVIDRLAVAEPNLAVQATDLVNDFRVHGNANLASRNWSGSDGTYSIKLPDGRIAWFFADGFVGDAAPAAAGHVNADHSRQAQGLVANQVVIQDRSTTPATMTNLWRAGAAGQPFWPAPTGHSYWPAAPFMKDPTTVSVLLADWNGSTTSGVWLSNLPTGSLATPSTPVPVPGALPAGSNPSCGRVRYHSTVLVDPDGSGYSYVYGLEGCYLASYLHVARIHGTDLAGGTWEYYTGGTSWSSAPAAGYATSGRIQQPVNNALFGNDLSMVKTSTGYRAVYTRFSITGTISMATSTTPWGPFSAATTLYTAPESGQVTYGGTDPACTNVTYNAKEQPALSSPSELVLSYNVGVTSTSGAACSAPFGFGQLWHQVDNYRPRFIRVRTVS